MPKFFSRLAAIIKLDGISMTIESTILIQCEMALNNFSILRRSNRSIAS